MRGNQDADFWDTKRIEDEHWFALIGVVANAAHDEDKKRLPQSDVFGIGEQADFTPRKRGGYLYCFANDAWHAYGNNKGSVTLDRHPAAVSSQSAVQPPSTESVVPVICVAASEQRNTVSAPISDACANSCVGWRCSITSLMTRSRGKLCTFIWSAIWPSTSGVST